ncbi:MAG: TetR/AcrR family transcriptional regulator [Polyangiaceae bacterium]
MRKRPQQARSEASVKAVVDAGAQVLGQGGWHTFTTNAVAKVAGVSIGTLYQYFPNKLALVEAIRRAHYQTVLDALAPLHDATLSLAEQIDALVDNLALVHAGTPALHRALLEEAPKFARSDHEDFERSFYAAFDTLIARTRRKRSRDEIEAASFVTASAVVGVIHDAARDDQLRSPRLRNELKALLRAYVEGR